MAWDAEVSLGDSTIRYTPIIISLDTNPLSSIKFRRIRATLSIFEIPHEISTQGAHSPVPPRPRSQSFSEPALPANYRAEFKDISSYI